MCKPPAESKAETSDTQRRKQSLSRQPWWIRQLRKDGSPHFNPPILPETARSHRLLKPGEDSAQQFLCPCLCNCIFLSHLTTLPQYCIVLILGLWLLFPSVYFFSIVMNFPIWAKTFPLFHSTFFSSLPPTSPQSALFSLFFPPLMWDAFLYAVNVFITIG